MRLIGGKALSYFFDCAWRRLAGLPVPDERSLRPDLDALRRTQWNDQFERLMRNRLVMGAFRYGTFKEQKDCRHDNPASIREHLDTYEATGNAEHLVDIANLALVEFTRPSHPEFHWAPLDDGGHHAKRVS